MAGIFFTSITFTFFINIFKRVNISVPTHNTICNFYKNFNYGLLLSQQMNTLLFILTHIQNIALNVPATVLTLKNTIVTKFG